MLRRLTFKHKIIKNHVNHHLYYLLCWRQSVFVTSRQTLCSLLWLQLLLLDDEQEIMKNALFLFSLISTYWMLLFCAHVWVSDKSWTWLGCVAKVYTMSNLFCSLLVKVLTKMAASWSIEARKSFCMNIDKTTKWNP